MDREEVIHILAVLSLFVSLRGQSTFDKKELRSLQLTEMGGTVTSLGIGVMDGKGNGGWVSRFWAWVKA